MRLWHSTSCQVSFELFALITPLQTFSFISVCPTTGGTGQNSGFQSSTLYPFYHLFMRSLSLTSFFRLCLSSKSQVYISRSAFTYPSECTATLTGPNWGLYPPHTSCLSHLWVLSVSSILISSWSLSSLALQLKKVSSWISSLPTVYLSSRHLQYFYNCHQSLP